jgi:hypothetical protein
MTPEDEAQFITLWAEGLTCPEIAQRLDIPPGTARSRAYHLQQRGLITARPKGGRRTPARQEGTPARVPAPAPVDASLPTREAPAITFMAVPEVRELVHTVKDLVARVAALEAGTREAPRDPPAPAPARVQVRVDIEQWTVRLSKTLIERIKAEAVAAQKPPSHLLEELAWKALNDQSPSTP